jgi:hypothetical protein
MSFESCHVLPGEGEGKVGSVEEDDILDKFPFHWM